jgi:hypothetical protein
MGRQCQTYLHQTHDQVSNLIRPWFVGDDTVTEEAPRHWCYPLASLQRNCQTEGYRIGYVSA